MKKYFSFILTAVIVGAIGFYGGMKYGQGSATGSTTTPSNGSTYQGGRGGGQGRGNIAFGQVLSKDATSFTLNLRGGGSQIIFYSASTRVSKMTDGSMDDVAQGANVSVMGMPNSDGSFTASNVQIRPAGQGAGADATTPPGQGGGGMGKMQAQTPPALTDAQNTELQAGAASHDAPQNLTFHVTGGMFYFVPNVIRVKKGDTVNIVFTNAGGHHDFMLDEFKVAIGPTNGGDTQRAAFTADKTGTFEFYCNVANHRAMGQKGQLIVE